jgi:hypothetical protein
VIRVRGSGAAKGRKATLCALNPEFYQRLGLSTDLSLLEKAWQAEVGGLGSYARIRAIDRFSLVVEVDSPVALQELSLRRRELVRRLNTHLGGPRLQNLTLRFAKPDAA